MEKTVRVCDECGEELLKPSAICVCEVCGREFCRECVKEVFVDEEPCVFFCPTHYAQVKEFIEGLKPKAVTVERTMTGYRLMQNGFGWLTSDESANALYDYMRRERGQD